jgi:hypothetical protein
MPIRARLAAILAGVLSAAALLSPSTAAASLYSQMLHVYQATGTIPACQFTSAQLEGVLKSTDTYASQYFADFTNAISGALAQRAAGACAPRPAAASGQQVPGAARNAALPLGPVTAATSSGLPTPIVLLAVLGGLLMLAGAVAAVVRLSGWEPAWAGAWRHAWSEAEYRLGGTWLEFVDWLRSRD